MENIIKFQNVSYKNIIKNINFEVQKGDFVGILGLNGSGKSTLAKLVNGLLKPSSGNVIINNISTESPEFYNQVRKKIGTVFQNPDSQIITSTVEEEIAFGLENLCVPRQKMTEIINNILTEFNMLDTKSKQTDILSVGEKQKLNIISTISMNPEILILDEPTSMIDPESQIFVANCTKKLRESQKTTTLLITHDIRDVLQANKIIVLHDSDLVLFESLDEFLSSEYTDFVIKTDSMKILDFLEKSGYNVSKAKISVHECAEEFINLLERIENA